MKVGLKIHPLFYIFGLYFALTGKVFVFIIYTASALLHECGHSFAAYRLGYRLDKIVLMPYGATVDGDVKGLKTKDELYVALCGPLVNVAVCVFFVALWWLFPLTYAYTDEVVNANFALAVVNFLPAFPLDGGRILLAILTLFTNEKIAKKTVKILGFLLFLTLFLLFIYTIFKKVNFTILFFSLFILTGLASKNGKSRYIKFFAANGKNNLLRGVNYKKTAVDKNVTIKRLMNLLDSESLNEIAVFSDGKEVRTLSYGEISSILERADIYEKLSAYI